MLPSKRRASLCRAHRKGLSIAPPHIRHRTIGDSIKNAITPTANAPATIPPVFNQKKSCVYTAIPKHTTIPIKSSPHRIANHAVTQ